MQQKKTFETSEVTSAVIHSTGAADQYARDAVVEGAVLSSDLQEMVLPVSQYTWIENNTQHYPLRLQRDIFLAYLPGNLELFALLEQGFDSGCAYRVDWKENPCQVDTYSDVAQRKTWSNAELDVWIRVTPRLTGKEYEKAFDVSSSSS